MRHESAIRRRWFEGAGLVTWLLVGLPVLLRAPRGAATFLEWLCFFLVFGAAFRLAAAPADARRRLLLAALQAACVVGMVALLCNGYEGSLLVLVAMQLAPRLSPRAGLAWIAVQTILFAVAVTIHWSLRPALMLAPPYLGFQILAFFVIRALEREMRAREDLSDANRELMAMQHILADGNRLAERVRISRELHDAIGHHLTALSLNLEVAAHRTEGEGRRHVVTAQTIARLLLADVRQIVSALHGPAGIDLRAALEILVGEMPRPRVHLSVAEGLRVDDPEKAHILLRCAQEIVTNAARHADADNLWLDLALEGDAVEIRARDDGRGTERVLPGTGLTGMRERVERAGGRLQVSSAPDSGFAVVALLPAARTAS
ncbi:MAG: sensor histidine kinase [Acidobacteriota bacterium]